MVSVGVPAFGLDLPSYASVTLFGMAQSKRQANLILGGLMALLAGIAGVFLYINRGTGPEILPAAAAGLPQDHPQLPKDHPPLDYAKDLIALEEMSRKDPQNSEYPTRIGDIYYDMGQYEKAVQAYGRSLQLRPRDPKVETDMATSMHMLGQHDKAVERLNKVLGYSPNFSQALFNKGVVLYSGMKDVKGAIATWEELLRVAPDFPRRADLEQRIRQLKASGK